MKLKALYKHCWLAIKTYSEQQQLLLIPHYTTNNIKNWTQPIWCHIEPNTAKTRKLRKTRNPVTLLLSILYVSFYQKSRKKYYHDSSNSKLKLNNWKLRLKKSNLNSKTQINSNSNKLNFKTQTQINSISKLKTNSILKTQLKLKFKLKSLTQYTNSNLKIQFENSYSKIKTKNSNSS